MCVALSLFLFALVFSSSMARHSDVSLRRVSKSSVVSSSVSARYIINEGGRAARNECEINGRRSNTVRRSSKKVLLNLVECGLVRVVEDNRGDAITREDGNPKVRLEVAFVGLGANRCVSSIDATNTRTTLSMWLFSKQ